MELPGPLLSPSPKNKKNAPRKKFLIFREMEFFNSNIKEFLIFSQKKAFLTFRETGLSYISGSGNPKNFIYFRK